MKTVEGFLLGVILAAVSPVPNMTANAQQTQSSKSNNRTSEFEDFDSVEILSDLAVQPKDRCHLHWGDLPFKVRIDLKVVPAPKGTPSKYSARVTKGKAQVVWDREGEVVRLQIHTSLAAKSSPPLEIEVTDPGIPMSIAIDEGSVFLQESRSSVTLVMGKGQLKGQGGMGEVRAHLKEGAVDLKDWKAQALLDLFNGTVEVKGLEGRLKVRNFLGKTGVQDSNGAIQFESYRGPLSIAGGKGSLEFKTELGATTVGEFEGDVHGNSESGSVNLKLKGRVNAKVDTVSGSVNVSIPSAAGARVYVASDEGKLAIPKAIGTLSPSAKSHVGRMGGEGGGIVSLRSRSGDIRVNVH